MSDSSDKKTTEVETKKTTKTEKSDSKWATMDKARISAYRQFVFAEYINHMVEQVLEHSSKLSDEKDHLFFKPDIKDFYTFNDFKMKGHVIHYGHPKPDGRWTERSEFPEGMPFRIVQKILVATHRIYLTDVSDSNISKNMVFCISNKFHRSERKLWHGYQFVPLTSKQLNKKKTMTKPAPVKDEYTPKRQQRNRKPRAEESSDTEKPVIITNSVSESLNDDR
jgi:hypothetical protein